MDDKDLPLVSNVSDILVKHYVLDLRCSFSQKCFSGSVTLYLAPAEKISSCDMCQYHNKIAHTCNTENNMVSDESEKGGCQIKGNPSGCSSVEDKLNGVNSAQISPFKCCLDCQDIIVEKVEVISELNKVNRPAFQPEGYSVFLDRCKENPKLTDYYLNFSLDKWSLKIWQDGVYCVHHFPKVIKIYYYTKPTGLSLLWVNDQDGCSCVFTYGAWINNRSLFPCQEPPTAMATWEAFVTVDENAVVLMSGDKEPDINCRPNGCRCYYYYTKMMLPMSTLALAVGYWKETEIPLAKSSEDHLDLLMKCRLFAPSSLFDKAKEEFFAYLPCCLEAAQYFLGLYPFPRIDILIVPRGFGSLGMASPNIIFLSQSVLSTNESMCVRLAHEIAHGWFGLLIGALDWTEEWLSEGFATFMEDIFHTHAMKMTLKEECDYCELKYFLRLKILQAEITCTDEDLQILRPAKSEASVSNTDELPVVYVKNGQNPKKGFLQIHYLKGYFLLTFLCNLVGKSDFIQLLKDYIKMYKGQLVQSEEIFNLYLETFPSVRNESINLEKICADWLDTSILPKEITDIKPSPNNRLYDDCAVEVSKWKAANRMFKKRSRPRTNNSKKQKLDCEQFNKLQSDQLVIVLESLLEEDSLSFQILKALEEIYNLKERNSDVRHRWCELIVKHRYRFRYLEVQKFLKEDLAMGVYLYGELLNSGNKLQQKMANDCFYELFNEMEPNFKVTIKEMIDEI